MDKNITFAVIVVDPAKSGVSFVFIQAPDGSLAIQTVQQGLIDQGQTDIQVVGALCKDDVIEVASTMQALENQITK